MAETTDPPRLLDDNGAPAGLRSALRAGREDLPSEEALMKVAAGLAAAPLLGAGAAKAAGIVGKGISLKLASAVVMAAVAGGGVAVAIRSRIVAVPAEPPAAAPQLRQMPIERAPAPPDVAPLPAPPPAVRHAPAAPRPAPPPAPAPQESEVEVLGQAQGLLASDPRAALHLLERHEQRFADGEFVQEREVIAIDALGRLGRADEAAQRSHRFEQRFPGSAHLQRVQALVQKNPAVPPLNGSNGP
jgi:hypothetical protein